MSDDFHRPTYTSANAKNEPVNEGHYNPTQVRLYGIPGNGGTIHFARSVTISAFNQSAVIMLDLSNPENARADIERLQKVLDAVRKDPEKPIDPQGIKDWPRTPVGTAYQLGLDMRLTGTVYVGAFGPANQLSSGIMFGYAYEGHTYDFPKPKIMLVPSLPLTRIPKDDSGYDEKEGYRVWIVDKLEQCVEIEANQGFVDQLVLEANMPGKRSPTQYKAAMALAHRGGRLNE